MASPKDEIQIESSVQLVHSLDMEDTQNKETSSDVDELSQRGDVCELAVFHTSHSQRMTLTTKYVLKTKRTFLLPTHFKLERIKEILLEVIPNEKQCDGIELTFLKVIVCASDELKRSIQEQREFCKIRIMTQVTDKKDGSLLVPHTHHDSVELGYYGEVACRWPLIKSEDMRQWNAAKFEITVEVVLETHPALRIAEAEEGYTLVSKLV